jgi:opacity protein-like surface antigen
MLSSFGRSEIRSAGQHQPHPCVEPISTHPQSGRYFGVLHGYSSIDVAESEWNNALANLPAPRGSALDSTSVTKGDFAWGVNFGYHVMRSFAVEIGYFDLGKNNGHVTATISGNPETGRAEIKSTGVEAAPLGILPLEGGGGFDASVGPYYGDNKVPVSGNMSTGSFAYENSAKKSTFLGGVGACYNFYNNFQVRFDYMYIDEVGDAGKLRYTAPVDVFSIDFRFTD